MKSGILKFILLSLPLLPLMVHAASDTAQRPAAATFDSGETDSAGIDAKLRPTRQLKDEAPAADDAAAATSEAYYPPNTPTSLRYADTPSYVSKRAARSSTRATGHVSKKVHTAPTAVDSAPTMSNAMPATMAAAAPSTTEPLTLETKTHWKIHTGERLSTVFLRWTKAVGWQLAWEPDDLVAQADLDIEDSFTGVTGKVIDALNRGGADMQAKFYASNHMLRIMARK